MFQRKVAFERKSVLNDSGRGGGERDVSLDNHGMHLIRATLYQAAMTASLNAYERLGHSPCALRLLRPLLLLLLLGRAWSRVPVCGSSPEPEPHWTTVPR
jgi:hypothetical protein